MEEHPSPCPACAGEGKVTAKLDENGVTLILGVGGEKRTCPICKGKGQMFRYGVAVESVESGENGAALKIQGRLCDPD